MKSRRAIALLLGAVIVMAMGLPIFVAFQWAGFLDEYQQLVSTGITQSAVLEVRDGAVVFVDRVCCEEYLVEELHSVTISSLQVDKDQDGLTLSEEIRRLTSDCSDDSDRDGISDLNDPAPNAYLESSLGPLLHSLLRKHIGTTGKRNGDDPIPVFIDSPFSSFAKIDQESGDEELVSIRDRHVFRSAPGFFDGYDELYSVRPLAYCPGVAFLVEIGSHRGESTHTYTYYGGIILPFFGSATLFESTD
ncbi:MAG: hypothetical protein DRP71_16790 [Verrucomicrobia bacterium]|nr:MAG: hypothetical protein DRP71_16790 [Verrucomicrobiota bacterium]